MAQPKNSQDIESKIIAKAWKDPAFKKRLIENPKNTLNEMGYKVPDNVEVRVVEDTLKSFTFVLRPTPANIQTLSDAELEKMAAAARTTMCRVA